MDDLLGGLLGAAMLGELVKPKAGAAIILLVLVITVPSCVGHSIWNKPVAKTQQSIEAHSRLVCSSGEIAGLKDYWGVDTKTEITMDGNESRFCTVTSAGRDSVMGTDDDLVANHQDINKSRIAGAWAKEKGIEIIKGVMLGNASDEHIATRDGKKLGD